MNSSMKKTITLDEDAYRRLKRWKRFPDDSFSKVIKRVVPEAGTLGALARFAEERGAPADDKDAILQETVDDRSSAKADPWI